MMSFILQVAMAGLVMSLTVAGNISTLSCSQLRWSLPFVRHSNSTNTDVCGSSQYITGGNFYCFPNPVNFSQADDYCQSLGARLCTVEEVEDDVTELTGCGLDPTYIWTSSARDCLSGSVNIAAGASKRASPNVAPCCRLTTKCAAVSDIHNVRCCADNFVPRSPFSCSDLQWPRPQNSSGTCGIGRQGKKCLPRRKYDGAETYCSSRGGRLCTVDEIQQGVLAGQGCAGNAVAWTLDTQLCKNNEAPIMNVDGSGEPTCYGMSKSDPFVRCCADDF
mmetsp:Transcript_8544/g.17309  ORF Transcript_8544/g.17309 Transcript_8544/m.17309 type:complete len:277 (-) Transcript_8544:79-909(-)